MRKSFNENFSDARGQKSYGDTDLDRIVFQVTGCPPSPKSAKVLLGSGLSRRYSRVAAPHSAIDTSNHPTGDLSRSIHVSHALHSSSYDIEKIYPTNSIHANVNFRQCLRNLKHICDGSHSHIYKGNFRAEGYSDTEKVFEDRRYFCFGRKTSSGSRGAAVVVKRVTNASAEDPVSRKEFERERDILSRLSHPNLIKIYGYGIDQSCNTHLKIQEDVAVEDFSMHDDNELPSPYTFMILERLDGGTLSYKLSERRPFHSRPFDFKHLLTLALQFASALDYLHAGRSDVCFIHRDLKPDNICFTADGTLKLMDFGLAIAIKQMANVNETYEMTGCTGSLRYMAPEVAKSERYNSRVDIFSFGIILYEMTTGVQPFKGFSKANFMSRVVRNGERPPLDIDDYGRKIRIPAKLNTLIESCWHMDPSERPPASAASNVLTELIGQQGDKKYFSLFEKNY